MVASASSQPRDILASDADAIDMVHVIIDASWGLLLGLYTNLLEPRTNCYPWHSLINLGESLVKQ